MKSFLQQIEEAFEAVDKTDAIVDDIANRHDNIEDELEEASTSGGAGAYMTPNAFSPADDDTVEVLGMKRVKESVRKPATYVDNRSDVNHDWARIEKSSKLQESLDSKYEQLIESYRSYKNSAGDRKPSRTIKETITDIARRLKEIEEAVNYASRFKNEAGVTSSAYGPSTTRALTKISERLIKISERVRTLGE
jgi:hypothetical protein